MILELMRFFACCFWVVVFVVVELKGFFLVVLDGKLLLQ